MRATWEITKGERVGAVSIEHGDNTKTGKRDKLELEFWPFVFL